MLHYKYVNYLKRIKVKIANSELGFYFILACILFLLLSLGFMI